MMGENDIKDFLKGYAELLKSVNISDLKPEVFPLTMRIKMPAGGIEINDGQERRIAFVSIDEGMGPSMPVGPAAMLFAGMFVDLTNAYYKYTTGDK